MVHYLTRTVTTYQDCQQIPSHGIRRYVAVITKIQNWNMEICTVALRCVL